jgi:zinc transport system ATP-binding protein
LDNPPAIQFSDLWFGYDAHPVLENVNISIAEQDFVSVVGPNGGGKTTLVKLVLGLLRPTTGTVRVFGVPPEQARPRIGYMPQHAHLDTQFPARVRDVVLMGRLGQGRSYGPYSKKDKLIAEKALGEVKMVESRNKPLSSLSGGQRQRVLLARALACEPEMLVLDEPTANLDMVMEGELYELLNELNRTLTVVMVSHDLGFVSHFVKSVVCVKRKVVAHPTSEITGEIINEIYGAPMRMVRHDHGECEGEDGTCLNF